MNTSPVFSVIIPVFNKWELTENCLTSLREHTADLACEVIVVDNGSSDATAVALADLGKRLFGESFSRIRFEENRNFAPACNAGARAAAAPLLFFLNNDTLLTPNWAPPLLDALSADASLAAVGPLLLYEDDTVQHLGVTFSPGGVFHLYRHFPAAHPVVRKKRHVQVLTGAAFLIPRELFLQQGGFFEEYRNGFEDVDFCLKLGATGKRFLCVPDSLIYHLESRSSGRHDHEQHNSALLCGRCDNLSRLDKHVFGLQDGFTLFVRDNFDIGMRLKEAEEEALFRQCAGKPLSTWLARCQEHPFWLSGREYLAVSLEKRGCAMESLMVLGDITTILRLVSANEQLAAAARRLMPSMTEETRADAANLLDLAEKEIAGLGEMRQDRIVFNRAIEQARKQSDRQLERLLEDKFLEIRRERSRQKSAAGL